VAGPVDPQAERVALWQLYRGLSQRAYERAESQTSAELCRLVFGLGETYRSATRFARTDRPPRRVAVALALALSSGPHVSHTLARVLGTAPRQRSVPGFHADAIASVLGIPQWELDDLRDEADRRSAFALKQARVVRWLHGRLETGVEPRRLLAQLAPALGGADVRWKPVATRLYGVLPGLPARTPAEVLGWLPPRGEPLPRIHARHLDQALRRSLARAIGAEPSEVDALVESAVALLPEAGSAATIARDRWRSEGWSALTGVGDGHVVDALAHVGDESGWRQWLRLEGGRLVVKADAKAVFDAVGALRCNQLAWALCAATLARVVDGTAAIQPDAEDLDALDFSHHLRAVVEPLLHWIVSPETHRRVAAELGADPALVARTFVEIAGAWVAQADTAWIGPPREDAPGVQTLLLRHALALRASAVRVASEAPDDDMRASLHLYAAHYAREARVERLWRWSGTETGGATFGWTDDPVGEWFPVLWTRLADQQDIDQEATDWG
jgi:hypothetical protein